MGVKIKAALLISVLIAALLGYGFYNTWLIQIGPTQQMWIQGKLPDPSLEGDYKGYAEFSTWPWLGKHFDSQMSRGINIFERARLLRFRTYVGKSVTDPNLTVLKLDYNTSTNSLPLRPFLDEIVQLGNGVLLGKAQLRIIPDHPFTLFYFRIQPASVSELPLGNAN